MNSNDFEDDPEEDFFRAWATGMALNVVLWFAIAYAVWYFWSGRPS